MTRPSTVLGALPTGVDVPGRRPSRPAGDELACATCGGIADDVTDRGSGHPLCPPCQDRVDHYTDVFERARHEWDRW